MRPHRTECLIRCSSRTGLPLLGKNCTKTDLKRHCRLFAQETLREKSLGTGEQVLQSAKSSQNQSFPHNDIRLLHLNPIFLKTLTDPRYVHLNSILSVNQELLSLAVWFHHIRTHSKY